MKKVLYKIISSILILIFMTNIFSPIIIEATEIESVSEEKTYRDFKYKIYNETYIEITDYIGTDLEIIIPEKIDNYPVQKIGGNAFYGCSSITKIELPESVTELGYGAFSKCINLKEINYPINLQTAGGGTFYDNEKLTRIIVPEGVTKIPANTFSQCNMLKEIILPSTLQEIGKNAFGECIGLTNLELPENVTVIGSGAYANCTNLETVKFSKVITKILGNAFYGCSSITKIELPESVTELGYGAFSKCINLKEINYPINLQTAGGGTFYDNEKLTRIIVPEGVTKIPANTFSQCNMLKEIILPSTLQEIGKYAFGECTSLKNIIIPESVEKLGNNLFGQHKDITIHCAKLSHSTISLIDDKNQNFRFYTEERLNPSYILDDVNSSYITNFSSTYNGGSIAITCNYAIKEDMFSSTVGHSISIKIPEDGEIIPNSVYLDKQLCQGYEETNELITIPVSESKGKLTFNIKMTGSNNLVTYAILNYYENVYKKYDVIGVICEEQEAISIAAVSITNKENIEISGLTKALQDVEIYIDDVYYTTIKSNKAGTYNANLILPNVEDGKKYSLKAKINEDKNEIFAITNIEYFSNVSVMTSFEMLYGGKTYNLLSETKPVITFNPVFGDITFKVKFSNSENVQNVYVTSDRNGVTKRIKANWNESEQAFVTTEYFDENKTYIPGKMNVYYTDINTMSQFIESCHMPEEESNIIFEGATATLVSETPSGSEVKISFKDGTITTLKSEEFSFEDGIIDMLGEEDAQKVFDESASTTSTFSVRSSPGISTVSEVLFKFLKKSGKNVAKKVSSDGLQSIYYQDWNNGDLVTYAIDTVTGSVKKAALSEILPAVTTWFLDDNHYGYMDDKVGGYIWNNIYGAYQSFNYYSDTNTELETIMKSIESSGRTDSEKQQARELIEKYEQQMKIIVVCDCVLNFIDISVEFSGISTFTPQGLLIQGAIFIAKDLILEMAKEDLDYKIKSIKGTPTDASVIWCIDPSGYVYEAVTTNRLENVKCELYYLDSETNKAVFWDAIQYNQINPLLTDKEGKYAWDVPEGLWKVKYSLDGYETFTTDWMEVPPPQTDVNIGLISNEIPTVTVKELSNEKIVITFSKYMKPETISNISILDKENNKSEYILEYSKNETSLDGTIYAKEFILKMVNKLSNNKEYSVIIPNTVKSYSNTEINNIELPIIIKVDYILGDVNRDGKITLADYTKILAHVKKTQLLTGDALKAADVNKDGKVTLADYTKVLAHVKKTALLK